MGRIGPSHLRIFRIRRVGSFKASWRAQQYIKNQTTTRQATIIKEREQTLLVKLKVETPQNNTKKQTIPTRPDHPETCRGDFIHLFRAPQNKNIRTKQYPTTTNQSTVMKGEKKEYPTRPLS
ncbi:hypothetical protein ACB092_03G209300 [Castanea dentata]